MPSIAHPYVPATHAFEGVGTSQRQRCVFSLGIEHWCSLVVPDPSIVSIAPVANVRREKSIDSVILEFALERVEVDLLKEHVSFWIRDDDFSHSKSALLARVDKLVAGHPPVLAAKFF